jgi:hypothetical protein
MRQHQAGVPGGNGKPKQLFWQSDEMTCLHVEGSHLRFPSEYPIRILTFNMPAKDSRSGYANMATLNVAVPNIITLISPI